MSNSTPCLLIAGIGSPHGDDQLGWLVVQEIEVQLNRRSTRGDAVIAGRWEARQAASPADLLDWLPGPSRLLLIDTCDSPFENPAWRLISVSEVGTLRTRSATGHLIGLPSVLELARKLERLPDRIEIWAIRGDNFSPGSSPSDEATARGRSLATLIVGELCEGTGALRTGLG